MQAQLVSRRVGHVTACSVHGEGQHEACMCGRGMHVQAQAGTSAGIMAGTGVIISCAASSRRPVWLESRLISWSLLPSSPCMVCQHVGVVQLKERASCISSRGRGCGDVSVAALNFDLLRACTHGVPLCLQRGAADPALSGVLGYRQGRGWGGGVG